MGKHRQKRVKKTVTRLMNRTRNATALTINAVKVISAVGLTVGGEDVGTIRQ